MGQPIRGIPETPLRDAIDFSDLIRQEAFQKAIARFDILMSQLLDARDINGEVELEARKMAVQFVEAWFSEIFGDAFPNRGTRGVEPLQSAIGMYYKEEE